MPATKLVNQETASSEETNQRIRGKPRPTPEEVHNAITQEYLARLKMQDAEAAAFELLCSKFSKHTVARIKSLVHTQTTDHRRRWEQKRRDLIVVYYRANGELPRVWDNHSV